LKRFIETIVQDCGEWVRAKSVGVRLIPKLGSADLIGNSFVEGWNKKSAPQWYADALLFVQFLHQI
jgi:hypothetical protein